jgi:phosphoheptose isomerase
VFAVIWKKLRVCSCLTLDSYKEEIIKALSKGNEKNIMFKDVYIVPNYVQFIGDHVLPIGLIHREEYTQHQIRFEAVPKSINFPNGCKVCYRAYCNDKVVELMEKPKDQCQSLIGQWTGLEPITVHCSWQPQPTANRQVEGVYILKEIPNVYTESGGALIEGQIPPTKLVSGSVQDIQKCVQKVRQVFSADEKVIENWNGWDAIYAPKSEDANEYVKLMKGNRKSYHSPLKSFLVNLATQNNAIAENSLASINNLFQFPELSAKAMPSVITAFDSNPPPPRLLTNHCATFTTNNDQFIEKTDPFYQSLRVLSVPKIKEFIQNTKIGYNGNTISVSGENKSNLVEIIKNYDKKFVTSIFSPMTGLNMDEIQKYHDEDITTEYVLNNEAISTINGITLYRSHIRQFKVNQFIKLDSMDRIIELFKLRQTSISKSHFNKTQRKYNPYVFVTHLGNCDKGLVTEIQLKFLESQIEINCINKIFVCLLRVSKWALIVIDFRSKCIEYLEPKSSISQSVSSEQLNYIQSNLKTYLNNLVDSDFDWPCRELKIYCDNIIIEDHDSGIFLMTCMYLLVIDCPIFVTSNEIEMMRISFVFWLIKSKLSY